MDVTRRDLAVVGALTLGASGALLSGLAGADAADGGWKLRARQGFRLPA